MSATASAEVDLTRYATPEEIAEAQSAPSTPQTAQVIPDVPVFPGPDAADLAPIGLVDSSSLSGVWLPHTVAHPIAVIAHGPRPQTRGIVIHVNDGYFDGTISWFSQGSQGVGAHLEIGNDRVWQLASLDQKCWHAVDANAFAIGFEHVGFGKQSRADWLRASHELAFSANRASWVLHEYGLGAPSLNHNIWPHSFGGAAWGGHACPGDGFPWKDWLAMCNDAYQAHWGRTG